jgi:hypothetical protein
MKKILLNLFLALRPVFDLVLSVITIPAALVMLFYRRVGSRRLPLTTWILKRIGIFPIRNHYYEPLIDDRLLTQPLDTPRSLPGINFNMPEQLDLLGKMTCENEFVEFLEQQKTDASVVSFRFNNAGFESGDAEFLFQAIRHFKPGKMIEVGSGSSTKIANRALSLNAQEGGAKPRHICIEPYEQPWLESFADIELIRAKVEDCEIDWRNALSGGDLLFIDSSHMIRPQGDVLYEYLNIIPQLQSGVIVHVHDIFSPRDYLDNWIRRDLRFWNEQYLLEAVLGNSARYEIIAALNMLKHDHYADLKRVCPYLESNRQPGSFYFRVR